MTTALSVQDIMTIVSNGRDAMPALGRALRREDMHDVATFIREELLAE